MTNHERYRAAFSHVHAPEGAAKRALERPRTPEIKVSPRRRLPLRAAIAAAAVLALLVGSVSAEIASGEISNLLAPLYGGAQTELVDSIGVPVGASVTVSGYTLTADAVIGDRYHMFVVYTLTRDDGEPIPEGAVFDGWSSNWHGSGSGSLRHLREDLPANQMRIVESRNYNLPLIGRSYTVTFQDLLIYGETMDDNILIAAGPWTLDFTLRYKDTTVTVPLHNTPFADDGGRTYQLQKLQISPLGLYVQLTAPAPEWMDPGYYLTKDIRLSLQLTDGTVVDINSLGGGGSWSKGDETYKAHLEADFETPIPLADMEAILFCDTEIPLDLG